MHILLNTWESHLGAKEAELLYTEIKLIYAMLDIFKKLKSADMFHYKRYMQLRHLLFQNCSMQVRITSLILEIYILLTMK
jgi:hypothetical protein